MRHEIVPRRYSSPVNASSKGRSVQSTGMPMVFAGELGRQQKLRATRQRLRPQLYGLGYPRQPSPRATLGELTFHCVAENVKRLFI